jgi:Holliday junction resolvasome RuvABC endonuclease subunit
MQDTITLLCNDPGYINIGLSLLTFETSTNTCNLVKTENLTMMTDKKNTLWDLFTYYGNFIEGYQIDAFIYEKPYLSGKALARNIGMLEGIGLIKTQVLKNNPKAVIKFYSPGTIKKQVAKSGTADKDDVTSAVRFYFQGKTDIEIPFNHAADSIAVGLTYLHEYYDLPINE